MSFNKDCVLYGVSNYKISTGGLQQAAVEWWYKVSQANHLQEKGATQTTSSPILSLSASNQAACGIKATYFPIVALQILGR
jgi:hypothetical protein